MKIWFLTIAVTVIMLSISSFVWFEQAHASCISENEIDWDTVLFESELVFTGTVTRLDNYGGPQKVTFLIHDVDKGNIDASKHVLENSELEFLENDSVMRSSIDVNYKVGKTYKVYVTNGQTNQCTTTTVAPPAGYMWEPGPEDGNYYHLDHAKEEPLRQYQDANERKSYLDALSDDSVVLPIDFPKRTDKELDDSMDGLFGHGLDHAELPIASIAIDYERGVLVLWTPELAIGDKIQELMGDDVVPFVLLYEEAPARWIHDGPLPEPKPEPLQDKSSDPDEHWMDTNDDTTPVNLESAIYFGDDDLYYVGPLMISSIVGGLVFVIWRKRR